MRQDDYPIKLKQNDILKERNTGTQILMQDERMLYNDLTIKPLMLTEIEHIKNSMCKWAQQIDLLIGDWLTEPAKGLALLPEG